MHKTITFFLLFVFLMVGVLGAPADSWYPHGYPTYQSHPQSNPQSKPQYQPKTQPQNDPQNQPAKNPNCVYPECIPVYGGEQL